MPNEGAGTDFTGETANAGFRLRRSAGATSRRDTSACADIPNLPSVTSQARSAPPLPKRNKGRFFVGTIFFSVFATIMYGIWTVFFQYQSYGIIQGRLITVSSPFDGVVTHWQIKEGEEVSQGQLLAEIKNLGIRHELEELLDDLKLNQAQLDAKTAQLSFESKNSRTKSEKAYAEFLKASAELAAEEAALTENKSQLKRAKKLVGTGNFSRQKYDEIYFEHHGRQQKIEQLNLAVSALQKYYESAKDEEAMDWQLQIQPMLTKIETIQSKIKRIREKIAQGLLRSPVSGRITKRMSLTGEAVSSNEPVLEILENNSTEAILFVPQDRITDFKVGQDISVTVPPLLEKVDCQVVRIGDQFEVPPKQISKYYAQDAVLLPVHMRPLAGYESLMAFRLDGVIMLPIEWKSVIDQWLAQATQMLHQPVVNQRDVSQSHARHEETQ